MKIQNQNVEAVNVYNKDTGLFEDKTMTLNLGMT